MDKQNFSEIYDSSILKYANAIGDISKIINEVNIFPIGVLAPFLIISLLLYSILRYVKLKRRHRAERIVYNEHLYREEELMLLERNRGVDKITYQLMMLISLLDVMCAIVPLGPAIVSFSNEQLLEKYQQECCEYHCHIIFSLMTKSLFARLYISLSKSLLLTEISLIRLLVHHLIDVYRDRIKHTNFKIHFATLAVKITFIISLDAIIYTFIPNLIISLMVLLVEYNYLRIGLKDLGSATKLYIFELERDYPGRRKTREFKLGYNLYRILSPLLSIGIFSILISVLFLFNVMPMWDFIANFNCAVHSVFHVSHKTIFYDLSQSPAISKLIYNILQLVQNIFVSLSTLSFVYPFTIFFTFYAVNQLILYYRMRRSGYPARRPELITELLNWHRSGYNLKNPNYFAV